MTGIIVLYILSLAIVCFAFIALRAGMAKEDLSGSYVYSSHLEETLKSIQLLHFENEHFDFQIRTVIENLAPQVLDHHRPTARMLLCHMRMLAEDLAMSPVKTEDTLEALKLVASEYNKIVTN